GKLTRTEQTFGSPQYMSPEQVQSAKRVDVRTDVWALGVILYEFLSETTPFAQGTSYATMTHVVLHPPKPLATLRPDLPPELVEVVMRCIQKSPALRFQSVPELAVALGPFAPEHMKRYVEQIAKAGRVKPAAAAWNGAPASEPGSAQAMTPPIASERAALATGSGLMRPAPAADAPRRRIGAVAAVVATLVGGTIAFVALTKGRGAGGAPAASTSAAPTPIAFVPSVTSKPEPAAPTITPTPTASAS